MSFRLPQTLGRASARESALSAVEAEIGAEKASSLGRVGETAQKALQALAEAPEEADRPALVKAATDAVWQLFVQRELSGLTDHRPIIAELKIPRVVLARLGAG
ncbi:MAG: hypothetical protein EON95_15090 [Caulobacteraceae bacterium]|nr:hypothetical protein [Caulobacter sp.]RYF91403.1 MAG: hypothetical protein EON95_15090 [Caulobacteraceae bacterium]